MDSAQDIPLDPAMQESTQHFAERPAQHFPEQPGQHFAEQPTQQYAEQSTQQYSEQPTQQYAEQPTQQYAEQPTQGFAQAQAPAKKATRKNAKAPATVDADKKRPSNKGKKHSTVYQKNALYGAYKFWRKKSEDLKAKGLDVSFDWKELFEFFEFSKTTGFKVIRDAEQDPDSLLKRDDSGKTETRGRKPKMGPDQIQQVEQMLDGKDPFQEGIEWKVIARDLGLEVHKHTVRRTMQARRKAALITPQKTTPTTRTLSTRAATATMTAPVANMNPNGQPPATPTPQNLIDPSLTNQLPVGYGQQPMTEAQMAVMLTNAS